MYRYTAMVKVFSSHSVWFVFSFSSFFFFNSFISQCLLFVLCFFLFHCVSSLTRTCIVSSNLFCFGHVWKISLLSLLLLLLLPLLSMCWLRCLIFVASTALPPLLLVAFASTGGRSRWQGQAGKWQSQQDTSEPVIIYPAIWLSGWLAVWLSGCVNVRLCRCPAVQLSVRLFNCRRGVYIGWEYSQAITRAITRS